MQKALHHRASKLMAGLRIAPFALVPLFLGSCVAQEVYDQAEMSAKHYQNQTIRSEAEIARLEEENRLLRAQLDAADVQIADAGYTDEIDERLKNLRSILSDIGSQPGDVTKIQVDGGYVYRVKDSILFDLGSSNVRSEGLRILREVAQDIESRPHGSVYVRGHTDDLPIVKPETKARFPHGNMQLSAARAVEVAAMLTAEGGIDGRRVVVMGFGPNDPVAANDSAANRQKNRRVDIFVADE